MLIFSCAECVCLTYHSVFPTCQLWSLEMMSDSLVMPFLTSICCSNEYQASQCTLHLHHSSKMPCSCVLLELCTCTDFHEISLTIQAHYLKSGAAQRMRLLLFFLFECGEWWCLSHKSSQIALSSLDVC